MADPSAIVYANAIYGAAADAGRAEEVGRGLSDLVTAIASTPALGRVLWNPAVPPEAKARVLAELAEGSDAVLGRSLAVLHENGRLPLLPDVQEAYARRYAEENDELDVVLTTAVEISEAQTEELRETLARATGKTIRLERRIDPAILGGIVLRVRGLLVDASIRRRLELLRHDLLSPRTL